jgi:hypothetical protein
LCFHALIGAHSHTAAQQGFAVSDRLRHLHMLIVRNRVRAMWLAGLLLFVWLVNKMIVPKLTA